MISESDKFYVAVPQDDAFGSGRVLGFSMGSLQEVLEEIALTLRMRRMQTCGSWGSCSRQWREQKQGSWEGKDLSLIEK